MSHLGLAMHGKAGEAGAAALCRSRPASPASWYSSELSSMVPMPPAPLQPAELLVSCASGTKCCRTRRDFPLDQRRKPVIPAETVLAVHWQGSQLIRQVLHQCYTCMQDGGCSYLPATMQASTSAV